MTNRIQITITERKDRGRTWTTSHQTDDVADAIKRAIGLAFNFRYVFFEDDPHTTHADRTRTRYGRAGYPVGNGGVVAIQTGLLRIDIEHTTAPELVQIAPGIARKMGAGRTPHGEAARLARVIVLTLAIDECGEDRADWPPLYLAMEQAQTDDGKLAIARAILSEHDALADPPQRTGGRDADPRYAEIAAACNHGPFMRRRGDA